MPWLVDLLEVVRLAEVCAEELRQHGTTQIKELILLIILGSICLIRMEVVRCNPV